MLVNCEVIVIFPIYGQVEAISKPNLVVCKTYIFINLIFHLTKTVENRTESL